MAVEAFRSRIGSALSNRDFGEFEGAWRECAGLHPDEHEYLLGVASQLGRFDKGMLAGELSLGLARTLLEKGEKDAALAAAKASLKSSQRTEGLRETLLEMYRARYAHNSDLDTFLEKSGLNGEGGGLRGQVDALDRYLTFEEGSYVYHRGGWGYGTVAEFDADEEQMVVDFLKKPGHRIGLLNATKILERLPDDHIGVYKHYRKDELLEIIKEDPAKVFHLYLENHGRSATLKNVREELVPDVLGKTEWSRWWGKAKKALLKDPRVRIGKGASPKLELREKAKSIEQEVVEKMQARADGAGKAAVAHEYLRTLDLTPELAEAVGGEADTALAQEEGPSARLALLYLKSDLKRDDAEDARNQARGIIEANPDVATLIAPLEAADRKRAIADLIQAGPADWPERVLAVLESGDADVADASLDQLKKTRPDILINFFADLSSSPRKNPALFLWYARGFMHGTIPVELAPGEKNTTVMEKLLTLANQIGLEQQRGGDQEGKDFLRHLRSFFTSRRFKMFTAFVQDASLSYAKYLYAKVQRNRGFTPQTKTALLDVIESEHVDIHTAADDDDAAAQPAPVEDVIYTTLRGYHMRESELKRIVDIEVPANAEDLGRAAAHGDISENAEYTAALEKQERLMTRVRELRADLDKARILDPGQVTTERVVVGTRVKLANQTSGAEETYALLGPWDSNVDQGIISYLSPVGRGLLGKTKGETADITLPEGKVSYQILDIEAAPMELIQDEEA